MHTIRSLKAHEIDEMYDLLGKSFSQTPDCIKESRGKHKQAIESDPFFQCELNRVVTVDGKLAARIGIYDRTMLFKGRTLRLGAIGGVCTAPEYRGRGYAKQLLENCTDYMEQNNFDVSLLFGEPSIYGKSGWETLSAFGITTNFDLAIKSESVLRNVNIKHDLEWLTTIYNNHSNDMTGPFLRTHSYWEMWINHKINGKKSHIIHIVESKGEKVGYFIVKPNNVICEIGYDKNIDGAFDETMIAIVSHTKADSITFSFHTPEIVNFISNNSVPPTLEMLRNKQFYIKKEAIYCGLFKLINKELSNTGSTEEFNKELRNNNYIFWDIDHF